MKTIQLFSMHGNVSFTYSFVFHLFNRDTKNSSLSNIYYNLPVLAVNNKQLSNLEGVHFSILNDTRRLTTIVYL